MSKLLNYMLKCLGCIYLLVLNLNIFKQNYVRFPEHWSQELVVLTLLLKKPVHLVYCCFHRISNCSSNSQVMSFATRGQRINECYKLFFVCFFK